MPEYCRRANEQTGGRTDVLNYCTLHSCMNMSTIVDTTLIRPLNEGQGHSFWYQSLSHIRLPVTFALERAV